VIHLGLLELGDRRSLEGRKGFLEDLLRDETTYSKVTYLKHCRGTSDPNKGHLYRNDGGGRCEIQQLTLITGSGAESILPYLRTHTIQSMAYLQRNGEASACW